MRAAGPGALDERFESMVGDLVSTLQYRGASTRTGQRSQQLSYKAVLMALLIG